MFERVFNFFPRFADAREGDLFRIGAGFDSAKKFAAGNDVEPGAGIGEQLQDRAVRVGFDRVTNEMLERRERGIEAREVIENRARTIYIERRAEFFRGLRKIDIFAVKFFVAIAKRMHRRM